MDIFFIPTLERLAASCLYYKGLDIRRDKDFAKQLTHLQRWWEAWERRPNYMASKCDVYTHAMAMPSQNGPGYFTTEAKEIANQICGLDGAWSLPITHPRWEPLTLDEDTQATARLEAAKALVENTDAIVRFACRGAGEAGMPSFHAELADPYAEPNEDFAQPVDVCLRHVTAALLYGADAAKVAATPDLNGQAGDGTLRPAWDAYTDEDDRVYYWNEETGDTTWTPPTQQLDTCLAYLRDRVGVPRDMSLVAATQLRAHLNWAIDLLQ